MGLFSGIMDMFSDVVGGIFGMNTEPPEPPEQIQLANQEPVTADESTDVEMGGQDDKKRRRDANRGRVERTDMPSIGTGVKKQSGTGLVV